MLYINHLAFSPWERLRAIYSTRLILPCNYKDVVTTLTRATTFSSLHYRATHGGPFLEAVWDSGMEELDCIIEAQLGEFAIIVLLIPGFSHENLFES